MSDIISPSNYYYEDKIKDIGEFFNSAYALDIAIETKFANDLFYGDLSRIVYASNEYCFKRRTEMSEDGLLDIPFMNYYLTNISPDTDRFYWKNTSNIQGLLDVDNYVSLLGGKLRVVPIKLEYEATLWFSQDKDLHYATSRVMLEDTNENILYGYLEAPNDTEIKNPAFMNFSFSFKPEYTENEWLESNKITSIGIDLSFDTFLVYLNNDISISEEVIFNFLSTKGELIKNKDLLLTNPKELLTSYFT